MGHPHFFSLIIYSLVCSTHTSNATESRNDFSVGCFNRTYDAAHLAKHPNQLVTSVRLAVQNSTRDPIYRSTFALQLQMRGRTSLLKTAGMCRYEGSSRWNCIVECDGGGVSLNIKADKAMMYLHRIRMATCDGNFADIKNSEEVSGGTDDREFRLDRIETDSCSSMTHNEGSAR